MVSEQKPGWGDNRYPRASAQALHSKLLIAPLDSKSKPSRAEAVPAVGSGPPPESDKHAILGAADYEQARASLIHFACAIDVPGRPVSEDAEDPLYANIETALAPHHRLLLQTVQRVVETPGGRAMILMPPGSAKSTYCSVVLPTF